MRMSDGLVRNCRRSSAGVSPVRIETVTSGCGSPRRWAACRMPVSGTAEVALDVDGEGLERGDVEDPAALPRLRRWRARRRAGRGTRGTPPASCPSRSAPRRGRPCRARSPARPPSGPASAPAKAPSNQARVAAENPANGSTSAGLGSAGRPWGTHLLPRPRHPPPRFAVGDSSPQTRMNVMASNRGKARD